MMRAVSLCALIGLAALSAPAWSDPSYTAPPLSTSPPAAAKPERSAPAATANPAAPVTADPVGPSPKTAAAPAEESGRYSFHRVGDNFIRLDSQTGQVAQCGWAPAGWTCQAAADERVALDAEIARLQHENAELKKSLLSHGLNLPSGIVAEAPSQPPPIPPANVPNPTPDKSPKGPGDLDFSRAVAFVKHVWQKLVDLMVDLQRDIQRKS